MSHVAGSRAATPRPTTFIEASRLSAAIGADITLASETFQHTGSFKFRGAYATAAATPSAHLIAASSGNFGQALAYACQIFNKQCTIVMPHDSAQVKVDAVRAYGAEVDLVDVRVTPRLQRVRALLEQTPDAVQVFPSDGEPMLGGNETLGAEIVAHASAFDTIVAPIGGGGVAVGCLRAVARARSASRVVGVEPRLANDVVRSFRAGKRFVWETEPQTIADGARTLGVSEANWTVLHHGLSAMLDVEDATIAAATRALFRLANLKAEPTAAMALAAVMESPEAFQGQRVCCIVTGGNVDPARYAAILTEPPISREL